LWFFHFHTGHRSILREEIVHIFVLEGVWQFFHPKVREKPFFFGFLPLCLRHFLVLSIVIGHDQSIWEFAHGLVIPSLNAKIGCLLAAKIDKGKLLWSGCDWIVKDAATEDEIFLHNGSSLFLVSLLLLLDSVVSEHQVQFLNDVGLATEWVDEADVHTCLWIKISMLLVKHHVKLLVTELQHAVEDDAVSHFHHYIQL
jgi:hypothetical protein